MANTEILKVPCPCIECICLPICRCKDYNKLFGECVLVCVYEPFYSSVELRNRSNIYDLQAILKPTEWKYVLDRQYSVFPLVIREAYSADQDLPIYELPDDKVRHEAFRKSIRGNGE